MDEGYFGPGIWIRVKHRFGPRMTEWFAAGHMIMFGYVLLLPSETFNQPAFHAFKQLVPSVPGAGLSSEDLLGWVMLLIGLLRIIGLVINGAKKNVTPQIRQFSAGVGCLIWAGICFGFASSDVVSTWLAIYPLFFTGELVNINRAARDQGEARNGTTG